jgi:hypothetical protein
MVLKQPGFSTDPWGIKKGLIASLPIYVLYVK